jgi:uncharacterized RDD family membrane protein YckC
MTTQPTLFNGHEVDRIRALEGAPLASFRARALAFVLDLAIVLALYIAVNLPAALRHRASSPNGHLTVHFDPFHGLWGLVALVLYFGLVTFFGHGRTPGKRLLRIRVVSTAHEHLSLWQSIERALGYGASALEGGFGFVQFFIHPNHRTVHDRIAETIVVEEKRPEHGPGRAA